MSDNNDGQTKVNPIQVQKYLKGVDYPVSGKDLLERAKQDGASQDILQILEKLQEKSFDTPADVSKEIGKLE